MVKIRINTVDACGSADFLRAFNARAFTQPAASMIFAVNFAGSFHTLKPSRTAAATKPHSSLQTLCAGN
jgi:hypothetical protein